MLAINPQMRRFVVGWIQSGGKSAARVARAAGYSDFKDGSKVRAWELMHNPKVIAALKEEADRRLDGTAILAILGLEDLVRSKDLKVRQTAIDSVLDRRGYGRQTNQRIDMQVEHVDSRPTLQILGELRKMLGAGSGLPVIDATFETVDAEAKS